MRPLKPLTEQTIVITGASSGIGRATALAAGRRGARVVLTARDGEALRALEEEIRREGGRALAAPGDVAEPAAMERVAQRAADAFGGIDTWVNNAAVSVYGAFMDITPEDVRRLMDVNFMGQVYGARAALPHLERQGSGALICVGSILSDRAAPFQFAYCASKHAVKALTEALRVELAHAGSDVQVTLIKPASMNTPLFGHARTYLGVKPKPIAPVYDPRLAAGAILHAAEHRQREITVGGAGKMFAAAEAFAGPLLDAYLARAGRASQATDETKGAADAHNLHGPMPARQAIDGEFGGRRFSAYTWARLHPRTALAAGVATAGGLSVWRALASRD